MFSCYGPLVACHGSVWFSCLVMAKDLDTVGQGIEESGKAVSLGADYETTASSFG